ncbi:APC family permease [Umboniibacter marinipuniceus]|uniref:Amino acid/polyamine/organocation transporter (APC superfamily) n=1 Tax=Umboniibacter marinipuniceus TaxID=569599 RepID=A0A3M0AEC9_9GAMM|nr:APC family permease [Umboniibacter marinipuniceus]RMA82504.1 amino acid/polyamine/organocation transporter (APC superfamily) [Umboniibacter marinipuniceus]
MTDTISHIKTLDRRDMVLFTVSAILLLDTLAAAASVGVSSLTWWVLLGFVFYLPFALICAEMGCAYPEQGGIYAWIRDAYGKRWASRASWCYWVNTAVWIPAIYILFAGIFSQLFMPDLSLNWQIGIGIVLTWIAMLSNCIALNIGKWVPNLGGIFKILIFSAVILGAWQFAQGTTIANPINWDSLAISIDSGSQYLPAIIYGMLGFELISASSAEMKDPKRDVPWSIFVSGILIIGFYILGTLAVLVAIPSGEINLVEGLVDTLNAFFSDFAFGGVLVMVLGVLALFTFFSNGVTWGMGSNRAAQEAAVGGELPNFFAISSKSKGAPVGAAIAMGVVSTLLLLLYGFMAGNNEDLFWTLFAFSAVIFLLPYQGLFLAFLKLRRVDAERTRPFKIPGGYPIALLCGFGCVLVLALTKILFMYVPGEGVQWAVLLGVIVTCLVGEVFIRSSEGK